MMKAGRRISINDYVVLQRNAAKPEPKMNWPKKA
jgi:hypothetical protein